MKHFKKIWRWLNGKKTTIGTILLLTAQGLTAFAPGLMAPAQIAFLQTAGTVLAGFGLSHKAIKETTKTKSKNK